MALLPDLMWQEKTYFRALTKQQRHEIGSIPHMDELAAAKPMQGLPTDYVPSTLDQMQANWEETAT